MSLTLVTVGDSMRDPSGNYYEVIPNGDFWYKPVICPKCESCLAVPSFPGRFNFTWDGGVKKSYVLRKGIYVPAEEVPQTLAFVYSVDGLGEIVDEMFKNGGGE